MKNSIIALALFAFLPIIGFSQSLDELKKGTGIGDRIEILVNQSKAYKSHYAGGVEFTTECESFFLVRDSLTEKIHLFAACGEKRIHEEFSSLQYDGTTAFQPENNSTWILKNTNEWVIFTLDMVRTKGWLPIKVSRQDADSLYLLERGNYLTIKGNRKWHNYINENGVAVSSEVFFEGTNFFPFYGGLIVPVKEKGKLVYRYIQYQQFLFWDDEVQDNVPDPHYSYLNHDGHFVAEEVVFPPKNGDCHAVIRNGNKLQVYSFCEDKIVEDSINSYYTTNYNGIVALTDDHIAFGNDWKRIDCNQPQQIEFEDFGDIEHVTITLKEGSTVKIDL